MPGSNDTAKIRKEPVIWLPFMHVVDAYRTKYNIILIPASFFPLNEKVRLLKMLSIEIKKEEGNWKRQSNNIQKVFPDT